MKTSRQGPRRSAARRKRYQESSGIPGWQENSCRLWNPFFLWTRGSGRTEREGTHKSHRDFGSHGHHRDQWGVPQARPAGSSPGTTSPPSKPQATASKKPSAARRHRQIGNASEREEASFLPETSSMRIRKQRRTPAIGRI